MRNTILTVISIVVFSLCPAPSAHADLRVKSTYIAGGQANETTVYSKGARQRFEPGMGMAIINQNDVNRIVQLFAEKKMYMIMSPEMLSGALPSGGQPQAAAAPLSTAKGGIVTVTIAITDTGERKQMFGYTARHVKNTFTMTAGADACNPGSETIDTDGWYSDYTPDAATAPSPSPAPASTPAAATACKDDVRVEHTGTGALGYPLAYKLKTTRDGKTTELGMEVVEFSAADLDAGLFEVPAGYTELKGFAGLGAMFAAGAAAPASPAVPGADSPAVGQPRVTQTSTGFVMPKAAGAIRVGVADVGNRAGRNLGAGSPRDQLVAQLLKAKVDAVPLAGLSVAEVEAASKTLECDYILFTEVTEVKKAGGGLGGLGNMLNKASAITGGAAKEKLEAKVEYRLTPIDGSKPLVSSTAKGTNGGGFGVTSAFGLAMNVTTFGMFSRMGMFDPNMMRLFGSMGGGMGAGMGGSGMSAMMSIPGMPRGGVDPGLSPFIAAMSATQTAMAPPEPTEDGKAVADAFADAAKKVSEALLKKR